MKKVTFIGGTHVDSFKELTSTYESKKAIPPDFVYIPLSQHIGAPCEANLCVGEEVLMGQEIGKTLGFVSAPIHSSVSGKVVAIEKKAHPTGRFVNCIVIENDKKDTLVDNVKPEENPEALTGEQIVKKVLDAGIVGLGGAAFPTHVKYTPPENTKIDYVILNGIECEPFITADHRLMLEYPESIVKGLGYILKATGAKRGIVAIEDNKMNAIKILTDCCEKYDNIDVVVCAEKYPQGGEKQLIYATTHREVPVGGLPLDVGVIVNNVGTAKAVCDAVENNMPLIERMVTVSGTSVDTPANYIARIGTLFSDLIEQSGGYTEENNKILSGGLMMGKSMYSDDVPITKGTSAILVLKDEGIQPPKEHTCVRCAKCIDVCPAFLEPTRLAVLTKLNEFTRLDEEQSIMSCIECGSCSYVCPANIPLLEYIRLGKQGVIKSKKK
ncbi:electron transport complex subunit RsxC [Clostridia bacterium]|nr:electron transport complex subunit RsxC [Clostridia bacterium]